MEITWIIKNASSWIERHETIGNFHANELKSNTVKCDQRSTVT